MQVNFFSEKQMLENMNKQREIQEKQVYIHFKGSCYFVETIAFNSENGDEVVVYRSLATEEVWVRPLKEFMDIKQTKNGYTYRFTLCDF